MSGEHNSSDDRNEWFSATSWITIQDAKLGSKEALESLCRSYWYPLYAYIRRSGYSPEDAEDLTQGFFFELLEKKFFQAADPSKGKFRSFLLVALKYFLENKRQGQRAQKRGGGIELISLDDETAEDRYRKEPASDVSPETLYEQHWARTVLEQVQLRLHEEYCLSGKAALYDHLKIFLSQETETHDYSAVAPQVGMKPNAVAVAVHRLRQRYRELVRAEIARTVANPADVDTEMQHFYSALGA